MQVQKKYPHRVQKTQKQVPHIFCDPRSKKKSVRSKKHVQVQKKVPRSQKTLHPKNDQRPPCHLLEGSSTSTLHGGCKSITFIGQATQEGSSAQSASLLASHHGARLCTLWHSTRKSKSKNYCSPVALHPGMPWVPSLWQLDNLHSSNRAGLNEQRLWRCSASLPRPGCDCARNLVRPQQSERWSCHHWPLSASTASRHENKSLRAGGQGIFHSNLRALPCPAHQASNGALYCGSAPRLLMTAAPKHLIMPCSLVAGARRTRGARCWPASRRSRACDHFSHGGPPMIATTGRCWDCRWTCDVTPNGIDHNV